MVFFDVWILLVSFTLCKLLVCFWKLWIVLSIMSAMGGVVVGVILLVDVLMKLLLASSVS